MNDEKNKINDEVQIENVPREIKEQNTEILSTDKETNKKEKKDKKKLVENTSTIEIEPLKINKNLKSFVLFNGVSTILSFVLEQKKVRKDVRIVEIRPSEYISIQI